MTVRTSRRASSAAVGGFFFTGLPPLAANQSSPLTLKDEARLAWVAGGRRAGEHPPPLLVQPSALRDQGFLACHHARH